MNPNEMTEEEQIKYVSKDGFRIRYIKGPSEAVQLTAVQQDGYSIDYINNPSEIVQLVAVEQNGWAIGWIFDNGIHPSNQVIFTALTQSHVIKHKEDYDKLVKEIFPNNTLLTKKWIRYGDNHRV